MRPLLGGVEGVGVSEGLMEGRTRRKGHCLMALRGQNWKQGFLLRAYGRITPQTSLGLKTLIFFKGLFFLQGYFEYTFYLHCFYSLSSSKLFISAGPICSPRTGMTLVWRHSLFLVAKLQGSCETDGAMV